MDRKYGEKRQRGGPVLAKTNSFPRSAQDTGTEREHKWRNPEVVDLRRSVVMPMFRDAWMSEGRAEHDADTPGGGVRELGLGESGTREKKKFLHQKRIAVLRNQHRLFL